MSICRKNQNGVTLTELMVVLAIISVGAAIAVPTYVNYLPLLKLRSATRELISDLRYTRQLAVTTNTRHRLVFTSDTVYQVQQDTSANWSSSTVVKTVNMAEVFGGVYWTSIAEDMVYFISNGGVDTAAGRNNNVTAVSPLGLTLTHTDTGQYRIININLVGRAWTD
jgi:prepilin-type N-terminal cleavage/methylation domain-containing protein